MKVSDAVIQQHYFSRQDPATGRPQLRKFAWSDDAARGALDRGYNGMERLDAFVPVVGSDAWRQIPLQYTGKASAGSPGWSHQGDDDYTLEIGATTPDGAQVDFQALQQAGLALRATLAHDDGTERVVWLQSAGDNFK